MLAALRRDRRERGQGDVQEPTEPDALAFALAPDPIHAVVPVARSDEGQPVRPHRQAPVDGLGAMLEQRRGDLGHARLEVGIRLIRTQERSLEEGHGLVEDIRVARDGEVTVDGVGEPEPVVGDPGSHAPARRRVPPVLHVTFDELVCRSPQEMLAGQLALRRHQGDDVLQLVAESVRAPGLVERRPRPQPAGERLVHQPAVEHDVHRAVGRPHLNRSLGVVPIARHRGQRCRVVGVATFADQLGRLCRPVGLAEQDDDLRVLSVGELEAGLQRGAGVHTGTDSPPQAVSAVERRRRVGRTIAAEELRAIGGPSRLSSAEIDERDATAELGVPRVANQYRPSIGVELGDDPMCCGFS